MPSDDHVAYHEERARGGVGLIVLESQAIHPTGKMSRRFINAWDPAVIPGLRKIAEAVHAHGAKVFGQLDAWWPHLARASAAYHVGADADAGAVEPFLRPRRWTTTTSAR